MANKSAYYPDDAPIEYSYNSVASGGHYGLRKKTLDKAFEKESGQGEIIVNAFSKNDSDLIIGMSNMISQARKAETDFLSEHNMGEAKNWSDLIKGMNYLLGNKAAFERNISILKRVADTKDSRTTYQDITKSLFEEIEKVGPAIVKANLQNSNVNLAALVLQKAINNLSATTDHIKNGKVYSGKQGKQQKNVEEIRAFSEMLGMINVVKNNVFFSKMVEQLRLDEYIQNLQKFFQNSSSDVLPKLRVKEGRAKGSGSVLEYVEEAVLGAFGNLEGFHTFGTGKLGHKADNISTSIASLNVDLFEAADKEVNDQLNTKSKRIKYITTLEKIFNEIEEAKGEIVFISDKNYTIRQGGNKYGGFSAQSATIENAVAVLQKVESSFNVEALQNYLGNTGTDMIISQPDDGILQALATQIGYFMFDDLSIETAGINRVHVFNLSGVYVPFSIILEGIQKALYTTLAELNQWANISFEGGGGKAGKWDGPNDFEKYRNTRLQKSKLHFHFINNFAEFVAQHVVVSV